MSEIVDSSLDYSVYNYNHSTLHYRNVAPQNSSSITLGTGSSTTGPLSFVISSSVFNPAKSRLTFNLNVAAGTNTEYNFIRANLLSILSRITIYDQNTSAILADINNVGNTYAMLSPIATKFDEFIHKSQPTTPGTTAAGAGPIPYEDIGKINVATGNLLTSTTDTAAAAGAGAYFQLRNVIIGAVGAATNLQVSIPLNALKHSFFDLDKMIYSPSNLQVDCYFSGVDGFAWKGTSTANLSTSADVANAITLSSANLQLATEGNVNVASQIIQKTMSSGLSLPIGYISSAKFTTPTGTSQSFSIPITAAYGKKVLYIAASAFDYDEIRNTSKVHIRPTGLSQYNTFINSVPILAPGGFIVDTRGEDYIIANKQYLEGSVIQNVFDYQYNWVHVDNFAKCRICDLDPSNVDGLDVMSQQANYSLQATVSSAQYNWYLAIVGQKTMSISSQGVMVN